MLTIFTTFLLLIALIVSFAFPTRTRLCQFLRQSTPLALCPPLPFDRLGLLQLPIPLAPTLLLCSSHRLLQ